MPRKVAVAVIHGVGSQMEDFADKIAQELDKRCRPTCGDDVVIRPVYWAPVMESDESLLWERFSESKRSMRYDMLRRFIVELLGDAIAYQPTQSDRRAYDGIHAVVAASLKRLAEEADGDAPLCIIAHSLGTVIASNYIYDLQVELTSDRQIIAPSVRAQMGDTPLERGETLVQFYTMGSPLALWGLRYTNFGTPIKVPSPTIATRYPALRPLSEWRNFYDPDDVIGFPLKRLNDAYTASVTADEPIQVGNMLMGWNPAAHLSYWTANAIVEPISTQLTRVWRSING